jgi:ribosome-associated protein
VHATIRVDERELEFRFVRSSGPGGQNVNKVSTAVQIRFDVRASSLPEQVKIRLLALPGARVTERGILLIEARRYRDQERNRQEALRRLASLVDKAVQVPRRRQPTTPSRAARERRLQSKKVRARLKRMRGQDPGLD